MVQVALLMLIILYWIKAFFVRPKTEINRSQALKIIERITGLHEMRIDVWYDAAKADKFLTYYHYDLSGPHRYEYGFRGASIVKNGRAISWNKKERDIFSTAVKEASGFYGNIYINLHTPGNIPGITKEFFDHVSESVKKLRPVRDNVGKRSYIYRWSDDACVYIVHNGLKMSISLAGIFFVGIRYQLSRADFGKFLKIVYARPCDCFDFVRRKYADVSVICT